MAAQLTAVKRSSSKRSTVTELRRTGKIPAVVYGSDIESYPIAVEEGQFAHVVRTQGMNQVVSLSVDGDSYNVMIKEVQREPLRNKVLHLDFGTVNMNEEIETAVPVTLEGEAPGVKEGGVLQQVLHQLTVRCLPGVIPESITVDISGLKVGDSITAGAVQLPSGVELKHEDDEVVVNISTPRSETADETNTEDAADQEEAAGEPEEPSDEQQA